jgi:hypothetical protein
MKIIKHIVVIDLDSKFDFLKQTSINRFGLQIGLFLKQNLAALMRKETF